MTEQVNTPELRFPEFKDEWREFNLKDISTKKSKKNKNKLYNETFTNSAEYGIVSQKDYFDKEISNVRNLSNYYIVDPDDFVYNPRISRLAPVGPINRNKLNRIGVMSPLYTVFSTKLSIKSFLEYYFKTTKWHKFMKLNGDSGARSDRFTIKQSLFVKMPIVLPSEQEQEKIGKFFSKLDQQIELEEKKLELLEQQKRGYMQKIFSQELRFKDENGNSYPDWSIKKIEDISKVNKGFTPNTKNDEYWDELKENWLSIAGMTQKYLYKGNKGITKKGASKHAKVDKDTLIMSFKLTLGKLAIVKEPIYTNEAICHFIWKESNVNTEYMYYYLNSINIITFGAQAVKGVTLNNDSINSIIVKLPVIQEQNKIAYFFNKLDKLIEKQSSKVELLKQRKQGLLQKMFV
ncbi:restriction endonuclease subunit S [Staphylococcus epidermidis]|uniref:restriction endonuclease subunit S n=1 Tax=Staphylococcus epidermidis TaxID=1282 RepID=UPI0021D2BF1C|nr:restriction endonuclease subunit S [Staphylococcus epidermidis]UXR89236.1 restriction endonuclease subunit S [Staphylococcus epidermidis]